jgi:hypothetical protein
MDAFDSTLAMYELELEIELGARGSESGASHRLRRILGHAWRGLVLTGGFLAGPYPTLDLEETRSARGD